MSFTAIQSAVNIDKSDYCVRTVTLNFYPSTVPFLSTPPLRIVTKLALRQSSSTLLHSSTLSSPYKCFSLLSLFFSISHFLLYASTGYPFTRFRTASLPQINSKSTRPIIAAAVIDIWSVVIYRVIE